jgi:hypothetical protein
VAGARITVSYEWSKSREPQTMQNRLLTRFWVETLLGLISVGLFAVALLAPDWMEALFGSGLDAGNGSAEWALALSWAAVSVLTFGSAGRTWRRRMRLLRAA